MFQLQGCDVPAAGDDDACAKETVSKCVGKDAGDGGRDYRGMFADCEEIEKNMGCVAECGCALKTSDLFWNYQAGADKSQTVAQYLELAVESAGRLNCDVSSHC